MRCQWLLMVHDLAGVDQASLAHAARLFAVGVPCALPRAGVVKLVCKLSRHGKPQCVQTGYRRPTRFASGRLSPLRQKQKARANDTHDLSCRHWLWRTSLWPAISRIISFLQMRQETGKFLAVVFSAIRSSRLLVLQIGHRAHPSVTCIIPQ